MSHKQRKGEPPERHPRSDRIVMARGRWYVTTRERVDVGPYETKAEAEIAASHLVRALDRNRLQPASSRKRSGFTRSQRSCASRGAQRGDIRRIAIEEPPRLVSP